MHTAAFSVEPSTTPSGTFGALLAGARPALGLLADDEAHLTKQIVPALVDPERALGCGA